MIYNLSKLAAEKNISPLQKTESILQLNDSTYFGVFVNSKQIYQGELDWKYVDGNTGVPSDESMTFSTGNDCKIIIV